MKTNYNKQADDFLKATNTTLEVVEGVPQKFARWAKDDKDSHKHMHYICTLKNKYHSFTFDFWGSVNDYERVEKKWKDMYPWISRRPSTVDMVNNKSISMRRVLDEVKPTAYDVLACLSPVYEDNFNDFCSIFGYDTDSITAHEIYKDCIEQDRNLRKLFDRDEIEKLSEIQ